MCLNRFALQQPKVDLTRRDGVEPQETTGAFRDDASTGLDYISDEHAIPVCSYVYLVCWCAV